MPVAEGALEKQRLDTVDVQNWGNVEEKNPDELHNEVIKGRKRSHSKLRCTGFPIPSHRTCLALF